MPKRPSYKKSGHGIKPGRIADQPPDAAECARIAALATYRGNPVHKSYPSPAGPPALRADEAKCDRFEREHWPLLTEALRAAISAGCINDDFRQGFPSRAWAFINGVLHEARLTSPGLGDYHAFPIDDPVQYPLPEEDLNERAPRRNIPPD